MKSLKFIDYYEVLQVNPNASIEVIKVAYRQLSKMYHPDISNNDDNAFILIKKAYDILSDKNKRNEYDEFRKVHLKEDRSHTNEKVNNKLNEKKITLYDERWIIGGIITLTILTLIFIYFAGNVEGDIAFYTTDNTTFEEYSNLLPKEEFEKIKTTDHILNHGEAYFDIYNGTNFTITSILIEINVKNNDGSIIDTRQFQKDVYIEPLSVEKDINITTGIEGLPSISENDYRIQQKYISWSYTEIIGDEM